MWQVWMEVDELHMQRGELFVSLFPDIVNGSSLMQWRCTKSTGGLLNVIFFPLAGNVSN